MRIEFTVATGVDTTSIPPDAWGRLQLRTEQTIPSFKNKEVVATVISKPTYFFPVGAVVDLPNGEKYITEGVAKAYSSARGPVLFGVDRPDK